MKRLFAFSGNVCAFTDCTTPLVDAQSGMVLGEICHITAERPGGPRYDAEQSDDERHGFDNIILMCPTHHTIIDADVATFTVARLRTLKMEHESLHASGSEPTDEIAQQFFINAHDSTVQVLHGDGHSVNYQVANLTVQHGLTVHEVRDIAKDVFHANFLRLRDRAAVEVEQRFVAYREEILSLVQEKLSVNELNRFHDPDIQFKLFEVLQHGVRTTDEELRSRLAALLVERIKADLQEPLTFLYNEAITTASRLTRDQVDLLGLIFVALNGIVAFRFRAANWIEFDRQYGTMIEEFTKREIPTWNVRYLQTAGCVTLEQSADIFDLIHHVAGHNQVLFQRGIPLDRVKRAVPAADLRQQLFAESEFEPGTYVLRSPVHRRPVPGDNNDASRAYEYKHRFKTSISDELLAELAEMWQWAISPLNDLSQGRRTKEVDHIYDVAAKNATLTRLNKVWFKHFHEFGHVELTFVGMTIAQTHLRQRTGRRFEINPAVL